MRTLPWTLALILCVAVLANCTPCAGQTYGWQLVGKRCGECGRPVSMSAMVGDTCPYCGARWGLSVNEIVGSRGVSRQSTRHPYLNAVMAERMRQMQQREARKARLRHYRSALREFSLAKRLERRGDIADAKRRYQEIVDTYPSTSSARWARTRLERLR